MEISDFLDFQVPRYLKSGLGRAGLGPWVGPWQCCAGARRRAAGAPAQHCHGPTQGPSPARPRPDLRYLGTWKSRSLESHGTLATKISEFWTYWNPCVKDFRILDLLEPLRQRFPDFQTPPVPDELSDPNLTPLPTHPGIKYVKGALAAIFFNLVQLISRELWPEGREWEIDQINLRPA